MASAPLTVPSAAASLGKLRFHVYRRMLNQRWRVAQAAGAAPQWYDDIDIDDLEYRINDRLDGPLSLIQRIECEAALNVIADEHISRSFAEEGCRSYHPEIGGY